MAAPRRMATIEGYWNISHPPPHPSPSIRPGAAGRLLCYRVFYRTAFASTKNNTADCCCLSLWETIPGGGMASLCRRQITPLSPPLPVLYLLDPLRTLRVRRAIYSQSHGLLVVAMDERGIVTYCFAPLLDNLACVTLTYTLKNQNL